MKKMRYSDRIRWRIRGQWALLAAMLVYMVVIGETGGGDSRIMSRLAEIFSRVVFFGGMIYVGWRISRNRKLLQDPLLLKEQRLNEQDERNQYLHDKSGGVVWDLLFVGLLFITLTASLYNMAAFYATFAVLALAVVLKAGTFLILRSRA